jgi:hypothetical protein
VSGGIDPWARVADLPGVRHAVADSRTAVDLLLRHRALRRSGGEVSAESAVRGARATAALDGVDWSLDAVRNHSQHGDQAGADVVRGALRAVGELGRLAGVWEQAPLQALARLHALAAAGIVDADHLGRPRRDGEHAVDPLELGRPPGAAELSVRLDALAQLLVARTSAPALVIAAIVHGELLALRPFVWGNGIVARAAERLVLGTRGFDARGAGVPEIGHVELRATYGEAARAYLGGTPDGVARWVRHCADAVKLGTQEGLAICEALARS